MSRFSPYALYQDAAIAPDEESTGLFLIRAADGTIVESGLTRFEAEKMVYGAFNTWRSVFDRLPLPNEIVLLTVEDRDTQKRRVILAYRQAEYRTRPYPWLHVDGGAVMDIPVSWRPCPEPDLHGGS